MPSFSVSGSIAAAATKTPLIITSGGTSSPRTRITQFVLSASGTPSSDAGYEIQVRRATTAGTATAFTPLPVDPAETACETTAGVNASAEPTYTANSQLKDILCNPRATWTWMPYQTEGELVIPATAAAGIGWQLISAGGVGTNVFVDATFRE